MPLFSVISGIGTIKIIRLLMYIYFKVEDARHKSDRESFFGSFSQIISGHLKMIHLFLSRVKAALEYC